MSAIFPLTEYMKSFFRILLGLLYLIRKKGSYQVSVVADGKLIHVEALDVLPAIESGGGDFDF